MIRKIISKLRNQNVKDVIWSFAATFFRIGGGLLVLPLILNKFSSSELGLWYFFTTVGIFVLMTEAGFSSTFGRNFRYVISNQKIYKYTIGPEKDNSFSISLDDFYAVARKLYSYISLSSFIILFAVTFYMVNLINSEQLNFKENLIAWILYALSISLNLKYYYRGAVLIGLNKIHLGQKIDVFSLLSNYLIVFVFLAFGFKLISLSFGVIAGLLVRILLYEVYIKLKKQKITKDLFLNSLKIIWPNTWRTGASNIFGYLIKNLNAYFITIYLSLEIMGSYGITFQIITLIASISTIWVNTAYPTLSTFRVEGKNLQFYNLFYSRFRIGIITYFILSIMFVIIGPFILKLVDSNTTLLSNKYLIFILVYMFFDFMVNTFGYIIMTGNRIPFLPASILTACLIVIFNMAFHILNFGLWGILLSTCLAGCACNYWYWVYSGYMELEYLKKA